MAWIESHQELEKHPKVMDLMALMDWNLDTTIGKLHRFWWWCVNYAEDGDLRKYNDAQIAASVGVSPNGAKAFVDSMVKSRWIDRDPYFRLHNWWEYIGHFLQIKYKHCPGKWQRVRDFYLGSSLNGSLNGSLNSSLNHIPNLTKPNQTRPNQTEQQQKRKENKTTQDKPPTLSLSPEESKSSAGDDGINFKKSRDLLLFIGVKPRKTVTDIAMTYPYARLKALCESDDILKARNPPGMLITALKENWQPAKGNKNRDSPP